MQTFSLAGNTVLVSGSSPAIGHATANGLPVGQVGRL